MSRTAVIWPTVPAIESVNGNSPGPVRPFLYLLGGHTPRWQSYAVQRLVKQCGTLVRTDRNRDKFSSIVLQEYTLEVATQADAIVCWLGNESDRLYLDDWTSLGYLLGRCPGRLIIGAESESDHPMSDGARYIAHHKGLLVYSSLEETVSVALEFARQNRRTV